MTTTPGSLQTGLLQLHHEADDGRLTSEVVVDVTTSWHEHGVVKSRSVPVKLLRRLLPLTHCEAVAVNVFASGSLGRFPAVRWHSRGQAPSLTDRFHRSRSGKCYFIKSVGGAGF